MTDLCTTFLQKLAEMLQRFISAFARHEKRHEVVCNISAEACRNVAEIHFPASCFGTLPRQLAAAPRCRPCRSSLQQLAAALRCRSPLPDRRCRSAAAAARCRNPLPQLATAARCRSPQPQPQPAAAARCRSEVARFSLSFRELLLTVHGTHSRKIRRSYKLFSTVYRVPCTVKKISRILKQKSKFMPFFSQSLYFPFVFRCNSGLTRVQLGFNPGSTRA